MKPAYYVVNVPLQKDNKNLKKVAGLELISNQNSGGPQTAREVTSRLIKETGRIYAAKSKGEIIGYITYKKGDSLSTGSHYIADKFKGNGVWCTIRARAIRDSTQ